MRKPAVVSLRGTSGSGKSTLAREIMKMHPVVLGMHSEGRKNPLCLICCSDDGDGPSLMVPGHYDIANGGVDTLPSLGVAYDLIETAIDAGHDVLYEGKNMSDGAKRVLALHRAGKADVHVVYLDTPLDECVARVRKRGHKIAKASIEKTMKKCQRDATALRAAGVNVHVLSCGDALKKIREVLKR